MKMYVTQSESCKSQIDYRTWKQREKESAEAKDLARLQHRYLKSADEKEPGSAKADLEFFYEKVFEGYTSGIKINPAVPDTLQSVLRRDLLAFDRTAAMSLAEATECGSSTMAKAGESFVHSSRRLSKFLTSADRSFRDFVALSSHGGDVGYLFVSERMDSSCMNCEGLHGQVFSLDELAEKNIIPPLHPNCKCKLFAMDVASLAVYNRNREGFIRQLDLYCSGENLDEGAYICLHTIPLAEFQCGR